MDNKFILSNIFYNSTLELINDNIKNFKRILILSLGTYSHRSLIKITNPRRSIQRTDSIHVSTNDSIKFGNPLPQSRSATPPFPRRVRPKATPPPPEFTKKPLPKTKNPNNYPLLPTRVSVKKVISHTPISNSFSFFF